MVLVLKFLLDPPPVPLACNRITCLIVVLMWADANRDGLLDGLFDQKLLRLIHKLILSLSVRRLSPAGDLHIALIEMNEPSEHYPSSALTPGAVTAAIITP